MKCPICEVDLVMADRLGVEIDYCPKCRGVWLDRGEIDKIIEKSLPSGYSNNINSQSPQNSFKNDDKHYDDDHGHGNVSGGHKKKSMLGELFDF